jgi:thiopurine S-methyltransferase
MEKDFWLKIWNDGKINFHKDTYNEYLELHFPKLNMGEGNVLVPLCGKTKDIFWLANHGMTVWGNELSPVACDAIVKENKKKYIKYKYNEHLNLYDLNTLKIYQGDFFKMNPDMMHDLPKMDLIYDRAALVALPYEMRRKYASHLIKFLKPEGKIFLISLNYPSGAMDGPPFSVSEKEIHDLYQGFKIEKLQSHRAPRPNPDSLKDPKAANEFFNETYILSR